MQTISLAILDKIRIFLEKYSLLDADQVFLVGFSGGVDSLCLLDALYKLSREFNFKIIAAHLNHNWRGEESKREEESARLFCSGKFEFMSKTLPEGLPKTEEEARIQRYKFFNEIAGERNITAILTGHTFSDQAETILYRIIKGTGIVGLAGIPEIRHQEKFPSVYRPIIEVTREETKKYCEENNLAPSIDLSNFEEKYFRNRLRLSLIPELKTYNSSIESSLVKLSKVAGDSEDIICEYLEQIQKNLFNKENNINTREFSKLSKPLQKRALLDYLRKNKLDYSYEKIEEVLDFIIESSKLKSGNTLSITENLWLFASVKETKLINSIKSKETISPVKLNLEGETVLDNFKVCVEHYKGDRPEKFPKETDLQAFVDFSKIKETVYVRTRLPGDIIQPFGMGEKTRLKKYLINRGIPEHERDNLLLLTTGNEVLWVAGVGLSELLRADNTPSHIIKVKTLAANKP